MKFRCPVCGYPSLPYPPNGYHICPCCSTEFGNDDVYYTHEQLREMWIAGGADWFFGRPPEHWNPWTQLILAGLTGWIPAEFRQFLSDSNTVKNSTDDLSLTGVGYPINGQEAYIYQVASAVPESRVG
jgi:hypothetical protein